MKQLLRLSVVAGLMTLGFASQASALVTLQLVGCQGNTCLAGVPQTFAGSGTINFTGAVVGNYTVSGSGSFFEGIGQSQLAQTTINVTRAVGSTDTTPLDVYVIATGYVQPNPPGTLDTTHTATFTDVLAGPGPSAVSFQGWINVNNLRPSAPGGIPTPGGAPVAFAGPVTIPAAGTTTNGLISCTPSGGANPMSCNVNGGLVPVPGGQIPFSLITRTTFNIPLAGAGDLYGSSSQVTVFQATPVPEPASMMLLGTGLLGLARTATRRRRSS